MEALRGPITTFKTLRRKHDYVGRTRRFGLLRRRYIIVEVHNGLTVWEIL